MNLEDEIVTVRPEAAIDTLQALPHYVGISGKTAGATGISLNVVIIPAGGKAQAHYHDGFETAIYLLKGESKRYGERLAMHQPARRLHLHSEGRSASALQSEPRYRGCGIGGAQ